MNIVVISVGPLREPYLKEGVAEYLRRLRRYASVTHTEVPQAHLPPGASAAQVEAAKAAEGEEILRRLPRDVYAVALDERGELLDSHQLAAWLGEVMSGGVRRMAFVVGGPRGLADAVLARADYRLSLSRLTFPHELACLIVLEQIYRAFKILRGETYHY